MAYIQETNEDFIKHIMQDEPKPIASKEEYLQERDHRNKLRDKYNKETNRGKLIEIKWAIKDYDNRLAEWEHKNTPISFFYLATKERTEQIYVHNRSVEDDVKNNTEEQLTDAVGTLIMPDKFFEYTKKKHGSLDFIKVPKDWDVNIWKKMINKPYKERLVIAGALLAAEYDRITYIENNGQNTISTSSV